MGTVLWRVSGYNQVALFRHRGLLFYRRCVSSVHCIFPSTTNASVAYVIKGFAPSNAWYCLAWWQFRLGAVRAQSSVNVVLGQLLCVPPLRRHTLVARNVYYVHVRAVWRVSRVVSGILADTVSNEQPNVDRRGLSEIGRSPFHVTGFHRSDATLSSRGTSIT
jgi:hypothetical protein